MTKPIGVGIIGGSAERGWAADAHVPALSATPGLSLVAISTSRKESADYAKQVFGVKHAFDNHQDLLACPDVDLVVVAVRVPFHRELVTAAIDAGKAVYCEWPLGNGVAEAEDMTMHAARAGAYAAVGLQARSNPVIRYAKQLVADGYVGRVLSSTMLASAMNWGASVIAPYAYLLDRQNGASMLTIPFGHSIDAFCHVLGDFAELTATLQTGRPFVRLIETGEDIPSTVADQVVVSGTLACGATAAIHFRGGLPKGTGFLWEINGTEGDLRIEAAYGHIQMLPLTLSGAREGDTELRPLALPRDHEEGEPPGIEGPALSVARAYRHLVRDWRDGGRTLPGFADALVTHRLIQAIVDADKDGRRLIVGPGADELS